MPARARNLKRRADATIRWHVVRFDPDITRAERRGGDAQRRIPNAGPIGQHRDAEARARAGRITRAVIGNVHLSSHDRHLRAWRSRSVLGRDEVDANLRRQQDDVDSVDRSKRNACGIEIDRIAAEW